MRLGGSASYAAQGLNQLGLDVDLRGVIGKGLVAAAGLEHLAQRGIKIDQVVRRWDNHTPVSIAVSQPGEKRFVGCTPLLAFEPELLRPGAQEMDLIYFGGYLLYPELWDAGLSRFLQRVKGHALVAVDLQMLPIDTDLYRSQALTPENLRGTDLLLVNAREAEALTGCRVPEEAAETLGAFGPSLVVIKRGAGGCLAWTRDGIHHSVSFPTQARDLVGAGDFFGAAFSHAQLQGWSLDKACDFANAFAALSIDRVDEHYLPSEAEVAAFMDTHQRGL